ncbi:hypothetical protein [Variovorax sp. DAIF25]|uniref:hypothetical protein n=1 Tax=Variovorax sp. DAIF25 TaxID=3080983 RepID=UPI003D6A6223
MVQLHCKKRSVPAVRPRSVVVGPASLRAGDAQAATLNDVFAQRPVISKVPAMVPAAPSDALRWCAACTFLNLLEFFDVA